MMLRATCFRMDCTTTFGRENQIAGVTDQGVAYRYDPEGRRVATVTLGAVTAEYLYAISAELATTVDGAGNLVRTILRDNGGTHWGDWIGAACRAGANWISTELSDLCSLRMIMSFIMYYNKGPAPTGLTVPCSMSVPQQRERTTLPCGTYWVHENPH